MTPRYRKLRYVVRQPLEAAWPLIPHSGLFCTPEGAQQVLTLDAVLDVMELGDHIGVGSVVVFTNVLEFFNPEALPTITHTAWRLTADGWIPVANSTHTGEQVS